MDETHVEVVGSFLTRVDADLACGALQAAGIAAMVSADDAAGLRPHLWMGGVRVLVPVSELERAREVLAAAENAVGRGAASRDDE
jgi:hypothetical protein